MTPEEIEEEYERVHKRGVVYVRGQTETRSNFLKKELTPYSLADVEDEKIGGDK